MKSSIIATAVSGLGGLKMLRDISLADINDEIERVMRAMELLDEELSALRVLQAVRKVYDKQPVTAPAEEPAAPAVRIRKDRLPMREHLVEWMRQQPDVTATTSKAIAAFPALNADSIAACLASKGNVDVFFRLRPGLYTLRNGRSQSELEWIRDHPVQAEGSAA